MARGRACRTLLIALTIALLLLVQLSQAKRAATIGGEFDMLGKACQSSLKMMVTSASQIGSCTQLADLVVDLASDGSESQTSVVEPVSEWETAFCSTSGCTPGAIKQAKKTLSASCAREIKAGMNIPVIALTLLDNYPLVRSLACTAAGRKKKGDYCLRQVMADLETATYKTEKNVFSPSFLSAVVAQPLLFLQSLEGMCVEEMTDLGCPQTEWCSRCLNYLSLKAGPIMDDVSPGSSDALYDVLKQRCKKKFSENKKKATANVKIEVKDKGDAIPYDKVSGTEVVQVDMFHIATMSLVALVLLFWQ